MHADEVDIDLGLAARLVATQFPQWAGLRLVPVADWGTDNAVFRLGEELALRLPRVAHASGRLELERTWLPALAPQLPLRIPVPLATGSATDEYPFSWSIYDWLPGENATPARVPDEEQLAADLAAFISALQRIDTAGGPPPSALNAFRGQPLERRDRITRDAIAALAGTIDGDAVAAVWDEALAAPPWERPPVWIHGDLDSRNLLAERGRLSGVVDFGTIGVGDPACDVMVAWKMLSADTRGRFCAALEVDDATWMRARGWALSQALVALAYYTPETNAVLVQEAERWLEATILAP